jgi:hypothetical protein
LAHSLPLLLSRCHSCLLCTAPLPGLRAAARTRGHTCAQTVASPDQSRALPLLSCVQVLPSACNALRCASAARVVRRVCVHERAHFENFGTATANRSIRARVVEHSTAVPRDMRFSMARGHRAVVPSYQRCQAVGQLAAYAERSRQRTLARSAHMRVYALWQRLLFCASARARVCECECQCGRVCVGV